jgi:hypothetical protein
VAFARNLDANRKESVATEMKPGTDYAVQIQALAQIGTPAAIEVLGEQLRQSITRDPGEQAWYWLDAARALRQLQHNDCLPLLFDCVAKSPAPLNQYLAAESVCFSGFLDMLQDAAPTLRRKAARTLHHALVGLRSGIQPQVLAEGRLGDAVAALWECHRDDIDPITVRVFHEALRLLPRAGHMERLLGNDGFANEWFQEQIQRIDSLEDLISDWLQESSQALVERLDSAGRADHPDLLRALIDVRADTAAVVLPMLEANRLQALDLAIESLAFTRQKGVGEWLCRWVQQFRGSRWRPALRKPNRSVYRAVLRTLRCFSCPPSERLLVQAASERDQEIRQAALGSLGCWEPLHRTAVLRCLHDARFDRSSAVQRAAQAALARLGERQALQWFRRQFAAENTDRVHHVLDLIAREGILLLWPDLDHLADAEDCDIAHHACEALELLREDFIFSASLR